MELLATGRQCKADECEKIGLVNRVVSPDQLMDTCIALAETIAANSATAIALGKQSIAAGIEMDLAKALTFEQQAFALTFATRDQKEGMGAFLEKRKANF